MSMTAGELARRWVPNWSRLARLHRSGPLRAFLGANLIAVVVILTRALGLAATGRAGDLRRSPGGLGRQ
jgi:hypothetical protein